MGCSFRLVGVGWGERDFVVTLVGAMTYSFAFCVFKWLILISGLQQQYFY